MKLFLLLVLATLPLLADDADIIPMASKPIPLGLTGNWNDVREKLRDNGVNFTGSYVNDLLGNPVGGTSHGFTNAGSFGAELELEFGKFSPLQGLLFFTSFVYRSGSSLSKKDIGNVFPVQQVYGSETYRLNELYFKQILFDERLFLKAGRLNGGNDFLTSPLYYLYVSNAYDGNPISIFFNVPFTAYPNATWGAYIAGKPLKNFLIRVAAYTCNTHAISSNDCHGANFTFDNPQGVLYINEWVYEPNFSLEGHYKFGWYIVSKALPTYLNGEASCNWGYYFLLDQTIAKGITPFVCLLFAPKNRNQFPFFTTAGIVFKIIPCRPNDSIDLGFCYGHYSTDLRHEQRMTHFKPQNFEAGIELNYWWQPTPWLAITPDIQYVINPSGYGTIKNALVLGAQIGITL